MSSNGVPFSSLETPAILVDMDKLEANISAMARMTAEAGFKLRPHTKCHKTTYIAELQVRAGACGVSVSKLSEAGVYADARIRDVMIVHPFYGDHKLGALKDLMTRAEISCVVDSIKGAEGLSHVGLAIDKKIPVLLKIDTGLRRFGVRPGEPALKMARELSQIRGIELVGILAHEHAFRETSAEAIARLAFESASVMSRTANMLRKEGMQIDHVVTGATTTARALCRYASYLPDITEIHPGAYVFGDWMYMNRWAITEDACAATVLVTVVSTPTPDRACIDAGSKTLSADPLLFMATEPGRLSRWRPRFGSVKGRPDIKLVRLTEEAGILAVSDRGKGVSIGDRLEILPNHISLAVNLHDLIYGVRNGLVEREIPVLCRGMDR